ncbi:MBL fold metallo-hydrolase [Phosphitispora sp. TUW77]|uniref:MBL fold metallo-hydrolase n=1 Tax=Phosphitispora sp. TUW77 TaxID=3152361 RepID=UPI003AB6F332
MILKGIPVGPLGANCYVVGCEKTKEAVVIDPGGDVARIRMLLAEQGLSLKYIIDTHGHIDHIAANDDLREATGAKILIHEADSGMLGDSKLNLASFMGFSTTFKPADKLLTDGDFIEFGELKLEVLHTPGHTPGGISLKAEGAVFTGDTLFNGSIGRTDFPGGDFDTLINSIINKLLALPDDTNIYPGHNSQSTVEAERKFNPFLR